MNGTQGLDVDHPLHVSDPRGVQLFVKDKEKPVPTSFALMATCAAEKVALRITGGCKGMGPQDKAHMLQIFEVALAGYGGLIFSGGTRQLDKAGKLDPMVTDIPGLIASENPECVALGTAPRTDRFRLTGDSSLVLDGYDTRPNPDYRAILLVQQGAEGKLEWDGDVDDYFDMLEKLQNDAGFRAIGMIAWNGGEVTRAEILRSLRKGWPTILMNGSGRVADELAAAADRRDATAFPGVSASQMGNLIITDHDDARDLRAVLQQLGFLR